MSLNAQAFRKVCRSRYLPSTRPPNFLPSTAKLFQHSYTTQSSLGAPGSPKANHNPQRKAITVTSDDGRLHWSELSPREKAARSTQQSVNFLIVATGAAGTVTAPYNL